MKVTDPVCGLQVDTEKAVAQEDYRDRTFFFGSDQCNRLFKITPERYIGGVPQSGVGSGSTSESDENSHE